MFKNLIFTLILTVSAGFLPAQTYHLHLKRDLPIAGAGFGGMLGAQLLQMNVRPLTQADLATLNPDLIGSFDRPTIQNWNPELAKVSDGLFFLSAALPALVLAGENGRKEWKSIALLYLETGLVNGALTNLTKVSVLRTRPFTYNPNAPLDRKTERDARFSFFSGHTSFTACLSFLTAKMHTDLYPNSKIKPLFWVGAAALTGTVASLRVASGKHFPTDVIFGSVVGAASGILIPQIHRRPIGKANLSLYPGANGKSMAVLLHF